MGEPVNLPRAEATRLGSYEIVRKLARGGMAELFLARTHGPEGFEKLVVLKKILPSYAENPKFVRLFLDEAKLAATLDHAHIAHVYDMGKVDGNYFFAMEYVHGQDVRTTLRRTARLGRQLPLDHAVQITRNVAAALHYAHERRRADGSLLDIVHRDVSPSNILVSYDGAVKLVDFGVAKATTSTVKTRTGALKGKIAYMSPEQAKGSPVDRRSDIFALGIVLWEMVTTQRLFKSDNDLATIQMIINSKPPPPTQLRPDCSPELERIVLRALASEADERYQTAEQLQLELEELAREQRLNQSSVALRELMHELFAPEIKAWSVAQASGQTLTEHLGGGATEMTTPVSESELELDDYDFDDEELDDDDLPPKTSTGIATEQIMAQLDPNLEITEIAHGPPQPQATYAMDQAPTLQITNPPATVQIDPSFPLAPREWRTPVDEPLPVVDPSERRRRQIIIGSSITFAVVVMIAIAFGGDAPAPAASPLMTPALAPSPVEVAPTPVEVAPSPVEVAPSPVETAAPPPAPTAPSPAQETAAPPPAPVEDASGLAVAKPTAAEPPVAKPAKKKKKPAAEKPAP